MGLCDVTAVKTAEVGFGRMSVFLRRSSNELYIKKYTLKNNIIRAREDFMSSNSSEQGNWSLKGNGGLAGLVSITPE